jgi:DNA-binding response OmpR family regulator
MAPAKPMRVLVADAYPDSADTLAMLLALRGFDVRAVYDGNSVDAELASWHPQAALLDLDLRDVPGVEVGRRARLASPKLTLIGMTGWAKLRYEAMATSSGFDFVLLKPVDERNIVNMLLDRPQLTP